MARRGPPGGQEVGEPGQLPPWWPNRFPPEDRIQVFRYGGYDWVAMYGSPSAAFGRFTPVPRSTPDAILTYQAGGPDEDATGAIAFFYSCIWRQVKIATGAQPPRGRKTWDTLAPSTKASYRGTMRQQFRFRTEEQFRHYYQTAPDLSRIRRHKVRTAVVEGTGRLSFPRGKDVAEFPWLATWQR